MEKAINRSIDTHTHSCAYGVSTLQASCVSHTPAKPGCTNLNFCGLKNPLIDLHSRIFAYGKIDRRALRVNEILLHACHIQLRRLHTHLTLCVWKIDHQNQSSPMFEQKNTFDISVSLTCATQTAATQTAATHTTATHTAATHTAATPTAATHTEELIYRQCSFARMSRTVAKEHCRDISYVTYNCNCVTYSYNA